MIKLLKKLRVLLDKKQKYAMAGLIVLMIIGAFLQTLGVGLLVEVVNVAVDPNVVETNWLAAELYRLMGSPGYRTFSLVVMIMLIITYICKNLFLFIQQKLTFSFVYTNQKIPPAHPFVHNNPHHA